MSPSNVLCWTHSKNFICFFRFGRRPMFFAGLLMLLIVGCVAAASPSMFVFIPFYILQGAAQTGLFLVAYTMCMYFALLWKKTKTFDAYFKLVESPFHTVKILWPLEIRRSCILQSTCTWLIVSNHSTKSCNAENMYMYIEKNPS